MLVRYFADGYSCGTLIKSTLDVVKTCVNEEFMEVLRVWISAFLFGR